MIGVPKSSFTMARFTMRIMMNYGMVLLLSFPLERALMTLMMQALHDLLAKMKPSTKG